MKSVTPKKKPTVKARKMWADPAEWDASSPDSGVLSLAVTQKQVPHDVTPVFVLPATQEAYDAMVEQMARGIYVNERRYESRKMTWETTWQAVRNGYLKDARAALAAINITPPTK